MKGSMEIKKILNDLINCNITIDEAETLLKIHQIEKIERKIKIDINRELRTGIPEVVYARNKDFEDIILTLKEIVEKNGIGFATKLKHRDILKLKEEKNDIIDTAKEEFSMILI
ncbi:hypothetical protein MMMIC1C10_07910 [Methanococcus maripaludis]|uniref:Uncharacterized protein n=1 Tax=Methanococcus maripaludis KA1 TaxID=637914 RepID=A0A2Z5PEK7_METMI|nr:hypothetical protein [Methanococcus maripaludis]BAP61210.1 hypothetical protein MMKA1_10930 [Methanococcus maripaludis KA1]